MPKIVDDQEERLLQLYDKYQEELDIPQLQKEFDAIDEKYKEARDKLRLAESKFDKAIYKEMGLEIDDIVEIQERQFSWRQTGGRIITYRTLVKSVSIRKDHLIHDEYAFSATIYGIRFLKDGRIGERRDHISLHHNDILSVRVIGHWDSKNKKFIPKEKTDG